MEQTLLTARDGCHYLCVSMIAHGDALRIKRGFKKRSTKDTIIFFTQNFNKWNDKISHN